MVSSCTQRLQAAKYVREGMCAVLPAVCHNGLEGLRMSEMSRRAL